MYDFAILILLGLALFKVVDLVEGLVPEVTKFHLIVTLVLAVAGAFAIDYSIFAGYDISVRETWLGTAATGLMVAGTTSVWRAAFHWLGSSEGEEPEVRHQGKLRSAA